LERATEMTTVVFDKIGTLTVGEPRVIEVEAAGLPDVEVLALAAGLERESEHPLAEGRGQGGRGARDPGQGRREVPERSGGRGRGRRGRASGRGGQPAADGAGVRVAGRDDQAGGAAPGSRADCGVRGRRRSGGRSCSAGRRAQGVGPDRGVRTARDGSGSGHADRGQSAHRRPRSGRAGDRAGHRRGQAGRQGGRDRPTAAGGPGGGHGR
jgi:hypothetical protein